MKVLIIFVVILNVVLSEAQISADFGGAGGGAVRFGETLSLCDGASTGMIRYESIGTSLRFCNGISWQTVLAETCGNVTPTDWEFTSLANQDPSTLITSSIHQVSGVPGCTLNIKVIGDGAPSYRICDDSACGVVSQTWSSTETTITNSKFIQLRMTTSASANMLSTSAVVVGTSIESWRTKTKGNCADADPGVGTICADGTIFVGFSPEDGSKLFATECKAGRTLSGTACSGTATVRAWATGATILTGITNYASGEANTTALAASVDVDSPYPAAIYCDGLSQHGYSDWYLPSNAEAEIMADGCDLIPDISCTSIGRTWTSTEFDITRANYIIDNLGAGSVFSTKTTTYAMRCLRK